ncbi:AAA family ATPase [Chitinimonas arctica]|uniref:AAA family ATPase n=1 Tax=Chitinimonas arctica TaxID=2594795 RepID=A0A516S9Y3_9NEIS|nr:AAA family ATPase [Chitinimonas arctica]QDQ24960.1 AAA family ATPase [Chitinimonas arctica]
MSIATIVLGESGTGKTYSLRNLDPAQTLLIQAVRKPLPFRATGWARMDREKKQPGNIFVSDFSARIINLMQKTSRKIIVLDDFQYVLANEFMRRSNERGFDKYTEIGRHAWDILTVANNLPDDVRVYILAHTQNDDCGRVKMKTIGKLLDDKITLEGLFTIVLRTVVTDRRFQFSTINNGSDTVKAPPDMFPDQLIDNDLAAVDACLCDYYGISTTQAPAA